MKLDMKSLLVGLIIGAVSVLGLWRIDEFSNTWETQRRLENYVTQEDSAVVIYSMRIQNHDPDIWDVGFRNNNGIKLQQYVVEKDTIFSYMSPSEERRRLLMDADYWLHQPPRSK